MVIKFLLAAIALFPPPPPLLHLMSILWQLMYNSFIFELGKSMFQSLNLRLAHFVPLLICLNRNESPCTLKKLRLVQMALQSQKGLISAVKDVCFHVVKNIWKVQIQIRGNRGHMFGTLNLSYQQQDFTASKTTFLSQCVLCYRAFPRKRTTFLCCAIYFVCTLVRLQYISKFVGKYSDQVGQLIELCKVLHWKLYSKCRSISRAMYLKLKWHFNV